MKNTFILVQDFGSDLNCIECSKGRGTLGHCLCSKTVNYQIAMNAYRIIRKLRSREGVIVMAQPHVYDCLVYLGVGDGDNGVKLLLMDALDKNGGSYEYFRHTYDYIYKVCEFGPREVYLIGQYYHMKRVSRQARKYFSTKLRTPAEYQTKLFAAQDEKYYKRNLLVWYLHEIPYRLILKRYDKL